MSIQRDIFFQRAVQHKQRGNKAGWLLHWLSNCHNFVLNNKTIVRDDKTWDDTKRQTVLESKQTSVQILNTEISAVTMTQATSDIKRLLVLW